MILRLRRRLTLLVIGVLVIVTAGIVFAISQANYRTVDQRAYAALLSLVRSRGMRPGRPRLNAAEDGGEGARLPDLEEQASDGGDQPRRRRANAGDYNDSVASLSNFFTVTLDDDGSIVEWSSDRSGLYTDEDVAEFTAAVLSSGREVGRSGDRYFRLATFENRRRLIVLDARLEQMAARSVTRTALLVASLACALLSAGAWLLISRMVKPVEQAFERQKQFVWDASHEFKTPLAVISANVEVLSGEIGPNEYLGYIQSEVRRTDRLVQNLLTLARMDKGAVTARMGRFDLSNAVLEVALPFESTVFEAGKTLETDVPGGVFARGDREMLQQLVVILLSNALKYSDPGGVIRLSLAPRGHGCRFSVYNTGPGIAPENLERIFDRFYREDLSHNSEIAGNGLGLAIARNIVDAHKGKIHAESEYGRSATFIVTLPG